MDTPTPPETNLNQDTKSRKNNVFHIRDILGLGKIIDKLNLNKLTARMTYCVVFAIIFISFTTALTLSGRQIDGFPNSWDMRFIVLICFIIFIIGILDLLRKKK